MKKRIIKLLKIIRSEKENGDRISDKWDYGFFKSCKRYSLEYNKNTFYMVV